ncbi:hypothetical protein GCM10011369_07790 [Neiella marina]|uniref:Uncharacterized protein n=1 Tax=Neiella marina TaxID=508461 RepID=A0A8J2U367_9GAMM|nr:hypothetical protein [Neiella marina]GGA68589.1 hypothetical protein GCM10011369_07790 [Neiella marina]
MLLSMIKAAFLQNIKPAIALQSLAAALVLCYYFVPATLPVFDFFADLKAQYGIGYAMVSTAFFGGLLPFIYLLLSGRIERQPIAQLAFYLVLWAWLGACVDTLYRFQGDLFGHGTDIITLAKKVAVDQFIYSAFYAAPLVALTFLWKEQGFSFKRWRAALNRQTFTLNIPANIASNWLVWIPAVVAIYSMPSALQIPLFNVVLCFYVLLVAVLNKEKS